MNKHLKVILITILAIAILIGVAIGLTIVAYFLLLLTTINI